MENKNNKNLNSNTKDNPYDNYHGHQSKNLNIEDVQECKSSKNLKGNK